MKTIRIQIVFLIAASVFVFGRAFAQNTEKLTLQGCQQVAVKNYPLIKQKDLIEKSREYNIANAWKGYYPQLTITGQASYQSEVTKMPITLPNLKIDALTKDQYRAFADVSQTIYDGGAIRSQADMYSASALVDQNKNEMELHKIKEQVAQIYFGILLVNEQLVQIDLTQKDIDASRQKLAGAVKNGTAIKSNIDVLDAEYLKNEQRKIEQISAKKAYLDMLGLLMNTKIDYSAELVNPDYEDMSFEQPVSRAELKMYAAQQQLAKEQAGLVDSKIIPKASLFFTGGYGKPGLNQLKNDFVWYYTTGIRFNWALSNLYTYGNEKEILEVSKNNIDAQKEAFLLNVNMTVKQQLREIEKLKELIEKDKNIIEIRTKVKENAKYQLENGIITSSDFITELDAEDQAKQNLLIHMVQLLKAEETYKLTVSN